MVFYVYFDPLLIPAAAKEGDLGLACLLGIIRGLEANCCLAEFDDWHVQSEIKDHVEHLEQQVQVVPSKMSAELGNFLKRLKSLLAASAKRNRFVYCLTSNGTLPQQRVTLALVQGKNAELDLILADNFDGHPNPDFLPTATLRNYGATDFEGTRSQVAAKGILAAPGEHPSGDPTPSEADIKVTRDLIRAGQLLKIDVLDHVIIGRATPERTKDYSSLRELGYFY